MRIKFKWIIYYLFSKGIFWLIYFGGARLVYRLCVKNNIRQVSDVEHIKNKDKNKLNILALSYEEFRGDLEVLANSSKFSVYRFNSNFQYRLIQLFYHGMRPKVFILNKAELNISGVIYRYQQRFQFCIEKILPILKEKLEIKLVINPNPKYTNDYDITYVCKKIGSHYISVYREGLILNKGVYDLILKRHRKLNEFHGDAIIVNNNNIKKMMIESGYIDEKKIFDLGAVRMQPYINKIKNLKTDLIDNKQVVLFSPHWDHLCDTRSIGENIFFTIHRSFIEVARKYSQLNFVIKQKGKILNSESWKDKMSVLKDMVEDFPDNLLITALDDAQDLILNSKIVVGYNTTTIFEAAIAGRHVIVPLFIEMGTKIDESMGFKYSDYPNTFEVADDEDDFKAKLFHALENKGYKKDLQEAEELFSRMVCPVNQDIIDNYYTTFKQIQVCAN